MKLTEKKVQEIIGVGFVLLHFATFWHLWYQRNSAGKLSEESYNSFLYILLPMFAAYTTLIVKYFIQNRFKETDTSREISYFFVGITIFLTIGFFSYINITITSFVDNITSIETYAAKLGIADTIFGVYLALILKDFYR